MNWVGISSSLCQSRMMRLNGVIGKFQIQDPRSKILKIQMTTVFVSWIFHKTRKVKQLCKSIEDDVLFVRGPVVSTMSHILCFCPERFGFVEEDLEAFRDCGKVKPSCIRGRATYGRNWRLSSLCFLRRRA